MTTSQINEIAAHLAEIPVHDLQRAALRYAALKLRETGESWTRDAALLLEQLAEVTTTQEEVLM